MLQFRRAAATLPVLMEATRRARGVPGGRVEEPLPPTFWYMGAKARLLPVLGSLFEGEAPAGGTILDLMSGTGIVAAHCARRFRVFANDASDAAWIAARSFIEHDPRRKAAFSRAVDGAGELSAACARNLTALLAAYEAPLATEKELLDRFDREGPGAKWSREYREFLEEGGALYGDAGRSRLFAGSADLVSEKDMGARREDPLIRPACLVTAYWANVYFGLRQSLEIDSIRAAIQEISGGPAEETRRVHYLSALLHAASISTSGTSHFAQPRHLVKTSELAAMAARRGRSVLETFSAMSRKILLAVLATEHRVGNRAFLGDFAALGDDRKGFKLPAPPDLVYFDPPYTADNYSRFYHVLDVIARYDYPPLERDAAGRPVRGRYPEIRTRFQSGFARASAVEGEFRKVIAACAASGAKLVISYSSPTGLLLKRYAKMGAADPVRELERLCLEAYRDVSTERHRMVHSGQGDSNIPVEELVVLCRRPR